MSDAEELAKYRAAEAAKVAAEKDAEKKSWLQSIMSMIMAPFNAVAGIFSGFGILEILIMGAIVGGLYFAAKANPEWAEKLVNYLPDDWQAPVLGGLDMIGIPVDMSKTIRAAASNIPELRKTLVERANMPQSVANVIAKDKETVEEYMRIVAEANPVKGKDGKEKPGPVNPTTFTNEKTLFALMTKYPERAKALAKAALEGGAVSSDSTKGIMASMQKIVNGPQLDILMSEYRAQTFDIIKTIAPEVTEADFALMTKVGMTDGKPNATMRNFLTAMLTPQAEGKKLNAQTEFVKAAGNDPVAAAELLDAAIKGAKPDVKQALIEMRDKLGIPTMSEFMKAVGAEDKLEAVLRLALKSENIHALPELIKVATIMPELAPMVKNLPFKLEALGQLIQTTGFGADGKPNVALTKLLATVERSPLGLDALLVPVRSYITSPEVASNPKAVAAIKNFIATVDRKALSAPQVAQLDQLNNFLTTPRLAALGNMAKNGIEDPIEQVLKYKREIDDKAPVKSVMGLLLTEQNRVELGKMGTDNLAVLAGSDVKFATSRNLTALLNFSEAVEGNPANKGENWERTKKIFIAATSVADGASLKDAFKDITAKELASFSQVPENHTALVKLLDPKTGIDRATLDPKQAHNVDMLWNSLGDYKTVGLLKMLSTEEAAALALAYMKGEKKIGTTAGMLAWVGAKDTALDMTLSDAPTGIKANAIILKNLIKDGLMDALTAEAPKATPVAVASGIPNGQAIH